MAGRCLLALLLVSGLVAAAHGQATTTSELLNNLPPPGSISTAVYFPEHPLKQFPAGDVITAVISAHNDHSKAYNLTAVVASLHSPTDFSMYIQNFTYTAYFQELAPGEEASLEYKFMLWRQVPTRDFTVAIHLIYEEVAGKAYHSNVVFNGTIEVVEAPRLVDTESIGMTLMIGGGLLAVAYWSFAGSASGMAGKLAKKGKRSADAKAAAFDEDDWVKGTTYEVEKRRKAAAAQARLAAAKAS